MGRKVALAWHGSTAIAAGVLYFFFVLPRWPELMGDTSETLGLILRIVCGVLVGIAALPVVFTQLRTRQPEYTTPLLALSLRTWSIVLQVLAALLIVGTAVSEIWVDLDQFGQILFGIYGAAAAIALLGFFAFYLSFVAEMPPPPPRPIGETKEKRKRFGLRRKSAADETSDEDIKDEDDDLDDEKPESEESTDETVEPEKVDDAVVVAETEPEAEPEAAADPVVTDAEDSADSDADDSTGVDEDEKELATSGLRNRRPSGKTRSRRRITR